MKTRHSNKVPSPPQQRRGLRRHIDDLVAIARNNSGERGLTGAVQLLLLAVFGVIALANDLSAAEPAAVAKEERTNIVLFLLDDLGWMDLHCQGNERLDTPNVDRLAKQGMRFTDAYSASPVCSPTRAAILTGKSPARLRITNHISTRDFTPKGADLLPADTGLHLPLEEITIAERLKSAGYATAFMGKWHVAGEPGRHGLGDVRFYPEHQGFDINLGGCAHGGPPSFFDPYRIHNLPDRRKGEYLPDRLADEAIGWMKKHRDAPFFLSLWHYTVHWPMEAPTPLIEKYKKRVGPGIKDPRYAAMIEAMDEAVGRVLSTIDELGIADRTLVIFASDNGGFLGVADNRPLRSGKGYLYEGGIRVPMIIRWPGKVKPGSVCKTPVISTDLFATISEAAGLKPAIGKTSDGESLLPLLAQSGNLKRTALYFHYPNYAWHSDNRLGSAIREGRYKLIENFDDGSVELFDLQNDLGEKQNLATQMPDKAVDLTAKLKKWRADTKAAMPTRRKRST